MRCAAPQEGEDSYKEDLRKLEAARRELLREVGTLARLSHPSIVQVRLRSALFQCSTVYRVSGRMRYSTVVLVTCAVVRPSAGHFTVHLVRRSMERQNPRGVVYSALQYSDALLSHCAVPWSGRAQGLWCTVHYSTVLRCCLTVQFHGVAERKDSSAAHMWCIAMEFMGGGTLRDAIKRRRGVAFPLETTLSLALDIARAMAYLHQEVL